LKVINRVRWNDGLDEIRYLPSEISKIAHEKNADVLYGF